MSVLTEVPQGGRAVVEQRAPSSVFDDDPERKRWRALDFFAIPPFASRAGAELIQEIDPEALSAAWWEPACGDGIMASCLREANPKVIQSDIEPQTDALKFDFLGPVPVDVSLAPVRWVVTNPPFGHAANFVRRGLEVAEYGVAILCRLAFLESVDRFTLHHCHLSTMASFCERVPMQLGPWNPECNTATAYGWFIYTRAGRGGRWHGRLIEPGTKARLSKPDDVRRFVKEKQGTLL